MIVEATAPTRIDLAGGTLDIWPLYLFEDEGMTLNAAVDIKSHVRIESRPDSAIHLHAEDSGDTLDAPSADALPRHGGSLDLLVRAVRFYRPSVGVHVATRSEAPRGSGIGASSSLLIALSHALNRFNGTDYSPERIIQVAANLEAQCIGIPTGKQDYFPPTYGGVNAIRFAAGGDEAERVGDEATAAALEQRLVLSFTGQSHFSGTNNWAMMKRYIDKRGATVENLRRIKHTALEMRDALRARDFDVFAMLLDREWQNRKELAGGVSNARIERLMAAASAAGALAGKICGAGGGGCMISACRPEDRDAVSAALATAGATVLPLRIPRGGVCVRVGA